MGETWDPTYAVISTECDSDAAISWTWDDTPPPFTPKCTYAIIACADGNLKRDYVKQYIRINSGSQVALNALALFIQTSRSAEICLAISNTLGERKKSGPVIGSRSPKAREWGNQMMTTSCRKPTDMTSSAWTTSIQHIRKDWGRTSIQAHVADGCRVWDLNEICSDILSSYLSASLLIS